MGGGDFVDVVVADVQVLLVPDVVDGHEANPVGLKAGRGGRDRGIKVRVVHKHADVLKRRNKRIDGDSFSSVV